MHDDDDIPVLPHFSEMRPIQTQHQLYLHWRGLMGRLGFSRRSLWYFLIEQERRLTPSLVQIEDVPPHPDELALRRLLRMISEMVDEVAGGGSVAFLLSRPGRSQLTESDLDWARQLTATAARVGVRIEPIHLANDESVRPFTPDDLIRSA
jgi:hypothetical protein